MFCAAQERSLNLTSKQSLEAIKKARTLLATSHLLPPPSHLPPPTTYLLPLLPTSQHLSPTPTYHHLPTSCQAVCMAFNDWYGCEIIDLDSGAIIALDAEYTALGLEP